MSFIFLDRTPKTNKISQGKPMNLNKPKALNLRSARDRDLNLKGFVLMMLSWLTFHTNAQTFPAVFPISQLDGNSGVIIKSDPTDQQYQLFFGPVGDLDNDGYADVAFSDRLRDQGIRQGVTYILYGSASLQSDLELQNLSSPIGSKITDFATGAGFFTPLSGSGEVSFVGDLNGDGFDDAAIGAFFQNSGSKLAVIFGSEQKLPDSIQLNSAAFFMEETNFDPNMDGFSIASKGDFNGDGIDDLASASPQGNTQVQLYFGSGLDEITQLPTFDNTIDVEVYRENGGLGTKVDSLEDINGDGFDDMIISTNAWLYPNNSIGSLPYSYVLLGSANLDSNDPIDADQLDGNSGFRLLGAGESGTGIGDVNLDGLPDFAVSFLENNNKEISNAGVVYVIYGSILGFTSEINLEAMAPDEGFKIPGLNLNDQLGSSIAGLGDINGDGVDDFAVTTRQLDPPVSIGVGASYIIFGQQGDFPSTFDLSSLDGSNGFRIDFDRPGVVSFSQKANAAGDTNGDGIDDFLLSVSGDIAQIGELTNPHSSSGESYLIYGRSVEESGLNLDFDPISDEEVGQDFQVNLTVRNNLGNRVSTYNGYASLYSSSNSAIDPGLVPIVNGRWVGDIVLFSPVQNGRLIATSGNVSGVSNEFDVTPPPDVITNNGSIVGTISGLDDNRSTQLLITVSLFNAVTDALVDSFTLPPGENVYAFYNVQDGTYNVLVECPVSNVWARQIVSIQNRIYTSNLGCPTTIEDKPPVLYVPGIMGSTTKGRGRYLAYPKMPESPAQYGELDVLNPRYVLGNSSIGIEPTGINTLLDELSTDFTVRLTPWDWRVSLDDSAGSLNHDGTGPIPEDLKNAWQRYLIPAIDDAKDWNNNGMSDIFDHQKVNVVAHSMGGLLVRAYIQSDEYRGDIDKFAMVGTPNQGAAITYYMNYGGDPKTADDLSDGFLESWVNFYTNTTENLLGVSGVVADSIVCTDIALSPTITNTICNSEYSANQIREYYLAEAPTGIQLSPSYPYVIRGPGTSDTTNENSFLQNLNSDPDISRMDSSDPNKVRTKLFASNTEATVNRILATSPPVDSDLYQFGTPFDVERIPGDGTVVVQSVRGTSSTEIPYQIDGLANLDYLAADKGKHAGLPGTFAPEIKAFLCEGLAAPCQSIRSYNSSSQTDTTPAITVSLRTENQVFVENTSGDRVGLVGLSSGVVNEIPNTEFNALLDSTVVTILDAPNDTYRYIVQGANPNELIRVEAQYSSDVVTDTSEIFIVAQASQSEISFVVDRSAADTLSQISPNSPPINVRRIEGLETLSLMWDQAADATENTMYRVYKAVANQTRVEFLGETELTEFPTNENLVVGDIAIASYFLVTSVSETGEESYANTLISNRITTISDFSLNETSGDLPLTVSFTDLSRGSPTEWSWDFNGDGVIDSVEQNPTFTYTSTGIYSVSLFVSGPAGSDLIIRSQLITVTNDDDNDGVDNPVDNCTFEDNLDQTDTDGDGYGNICDADFNNDCVVNFLDVAAFSNEFLGSSPLFDLNVDGAVNFLDYTIVANSFLQAPGPGLGICN